MSEQKTHAEIIAGMRREADADICLGHGIEGILKRNLADELDAAHKRERGDCAKLRKALKDIGRIVEQIRLLYSDYPSEIHEIARKVNAALAAPARNCDMFGSYTQAKEEWWKTEVLPRVDGVVTGAEPPFADWLYAPATEKEGGAK